MTWTRETVKSEVHRLLGQHTQEGVAIRDTSHLVGDLGFDSLGVMEVIADIEDTFKLHIPDDALREVGTVADVAKAIETRLQRDGRLQG